VAVALVLAGCDSARFGNRGPELSTRRPPSRSAAAEPPPVQAIPSESVTSEPLPPPPGSAAPAPSSGFGSGPVVADVPSMPVAPAPVETMTPVSGGNPAAATPAPVAVSGGSSRSASVGAWTAREATGTSCRVQLSSAPALDLYKASASGCSNKDLARITAWDYRDGEVYLYQPGGAVAARLRSSSGSLEGVLAKSGAPLTLSRS
jgi:hypothetical protein